MTNKREIDPAVKRSATETLAHTGEARRLTAELARSRGVPVPAMPPTGFEDIEEEITGMHEALDRLAARESRESQPEASVRVGPVHVRLASVPSWMLALVVLLLAAIAGFVWVATHPPTPASVPVVAPIHS